MAQDLNSLTIGWDLDEDGTLDAPNPTSVYGSTKLEGERLALAAHPDLYDAFDGSPHRWGDYTGATPDPNGTDFWYMGQISEGSNPIAQWGTNIVHVQTACVVP